NLLVEDIIHKIIMKYGGKDNKPCDPEELIIYCDTDDFENDKDSYKAH
ncbi:hypothetical protein AC249_AIPGENE2748, partial [Exaiptasia diaphana]